MNRAAFAQLRVVSECFYDVQQTRISCRNRMERGRSGEPMPSEELLTLGEVLDLSEKTFGKRMVELLREAVPPELRAWIEASAGIGEPTMARLLGITGHPRIAQPYHWQGTGSDRKLVADEVFERTVSDLWSYCGHGDPKRKRIRGMSAEEAARLGNPQAKKLVWLMADGCVKNKNSAYRMTYELRRRETEDRTHVEECVRCGPSGKPALPGSSWSKAHQLADAKRIVGKTILRDMWVATPL